MTKWRRRAFGVAVIAITATLAFAAAGGMGELTAVPRILGIRQPVGTTQTGALMLTNTGGSSAFMVKDIIYNCGGVQLQGGSGGSAFTVGPGSAQPITVECLNTLTPGMHRCTFTARDMMNQSLTSFDGFCETDAQQKLIAAPPSLLFSNAQVGVETAAQQVSITNQDANVAVPILQLQVDDDNFLIGTPCQNSLGCDVAGIAKGSNIGIDVLCKPQSMGTHTGHLFVVGDNGFALAMPINLSCTTGAGSGSGGPVLTVTPPSVLIGGTVEVDGGSGQQTVILKNAGSGSLSITSLQISDDGVVGAGSDWTVTSVDGQCADLSTPCDLGAQQSINAHLVFDPSGFNSRHAKMVVNYTDPMGNKQQAVALDGTGVGATLELIAGSSLEFGTIPLNTASMTLSFTLRNQGNRPAMATFTPSPLAPYMFPSSTTVDPGQKTISVSCQSMTEIDSTQTLTINGSDAPPSPDTVGLHCNVKNTLIIANPSAISILEARTGTTIPGVPITVSRVGSGAPIGLINPPILAPADSNLSISSLTQNTTPAMTTLTVNPQIDRDIVVPTNITVTPTAGQSLDIPVSGSVVTAAFAISGVTSLGTFCVGQPTSSTSVSFTSTGTAHIMVTGVSLAAGAASQFTLMNGTPTTYPTTLDPKIGKATVVITPKRADAAGSALDEVVWANDAAAATTQVSVKYIADGGAIAPAALDFGDTPIRIVADNDQQVTVQNCSAGQLELIKPDVPKPFELTGPFPTSLGPADSATFSIAFRPTAIGAVEQTLVVSSTDSMDFAVTLRGNGISGSGSGGDDDGIGDETSFYACGCSSKRGGDPLGVLAVAFASMCGVVARRKRRKTR